MMPDLRSIATQGSFFPEAHIVAKTMGGKGITWSEIQQKIGRLATRLTTVCDQNVALYHTDTVDFIVGLLAIWRLGKTAVIPANTNDVTLKALAKITSTFIGDIDVPALCGDADLMIQQHQSQSLALVMFTSGSTGIPAPVTKTFSQLDAELKILEHHWGEAIQNSLFVGTVSHHHMYGLPFRLLWPLASGRHFLTTELGYLEQLSSIPQQSTILISSPAHLENLPPSLDWTLLRGKLRAVFSAGSALSLAAAIRVEQTVGVAVTEIYGSTETGAVGHRNQLDDPLWASLNGISVNDNAGRLMLKSPALAIDQWAPTDDLCVMSADNRFKLNGRVDQIVKIGGKRVSVANIESQLRRHAWVSQVRVTLLPSKKSRIGAVIKLTADGNAKLIDSNKRTICKVLSSSLQPYVDQVALPRYWRFVNKMPVDRQGKISVSELASLFFESQRPKLPTVVNQSSNADKNYIIDLIVPKNLIYFDGHFPGTPVLPGMIQVGWAIHFAAKLFGNIGEFRRLDKLKFHNVIQPDEAISLNLRWDKQLYSLSFRYSRDMLAHSSGRIVFAGARP